MRNRVYVYRVYFPTSGKCYIGQTNDLNRRMKEHLETGSLVCSALWKYDDWQWSILHTCKTRDDANRIEIEEIRNFNSVAPNGYNLTHGGDAGQLCDESRAKISNTLKGRKLSAETRIKIGLASKGRVVSEETRAKIAESNTGQKRSAETKVNISNAQKGKKISAETRVKMSKSHSNTSSETRAKMAAAAMGNKNSKGYKQTDEHKATVAAAKIGVPRPDAKERMLKNNPMSNPVVSAKHWIKRYKKLIHKLELELTEENKHES